MQHASARPRTAVLVGCLHCQLDAGTPAAVMPVRLLYRAYPPTYSTYQYEVQRHLPYRTLFGLSNAADATGTDAETMQCMHAVL